jgi:hypothetical protein
MHQLLTFTPYEAHRLGAALIKAARQLDADAGRHLGHDPHDAADHAHEC